MRELLFGLFLCISISSVANGSFFEPSLKNKASYDKLYGKLPTVEAVRNIIEQLPDGDPDIGYFEFALIYAFWGTGDYEAVDSTYHLVKEHFDACDNVIMSCNVDIVYNSILIYKGEVSKGFNSLCKLNDKIDLLISHEGLSKDYLQLKYYVSYELANVCNELGRYEEADKYCTLATEIMEEADEVDPYAYNLHAVIKLRLSRPDESVQLYDKILETAHKYNDSILARLVYHNVQNIYVEQDRSDMALMFGKKLFDYNPTSDTIHMPEHTLFVRYLVDYAKVLMREECNENARDTLNLAIRILRPNTPDDVKQVLYMEYANLLHKFHKNDSSTLYYEKSLDLISDKTDDRNKYNLYALYGIKLKSDSLYNNSKTMLESSLVYYNKKGGIILIEVLDALADLEFNHYNNPKRAYELLSEAYAERSNLYKKKYINRLSSFEAEYKTKEIETKLKLANIRREAANTKFLYSLVISLLIIILVLCVFSVFIYYHKRREVSYKNKELSLQLKISEANHRVYKTTKDINRKIREKYIKGMEDSNKHLSKELHDGICNKLLVLQMQFKENTDERLLQGLDKIRNEVRDLSHQLASPEFNDIDIDIVLGDLVNRVRELSMFDIDLFIDENATYWLDSSSSKLDLYRFLQEAISNIIKHARAKRVSITLSNTEGMVDLVIEDDGVGFVVDGSYKTLGLRTMAERVEACQGMLEINSKPGKGTLIRATFK